MLKVLKKMFVFIAASIFIFTAGIIFMMDKVQSYGEEKIITSDKLPNDIDVILVLGAGIKDDGTPCDMLVDRLKTSIEVKNKLGSKVKFLLTGDHSKTDYNEVGAMKKFIQSNCNINDSDIFLDHAGFSTYESIYRAKEIFKVNKMIIVTNEYHLPRAIYIANNLGIEAYGVPSDIRNYWDIQTYENRERLAQVKDYILVNIIKPTPKFLGNEIPVDSSDGKSTDDEV
ncbi:MAG: SanA protein [Clostridium sp.]|nr:SanA protein [Clostridium sp.]